MVWVSNRENYKAEADASKKQARAMLASVIPFSRWRTGKSPKETRMYLMVMRETMKVADLKPEEHERECARLELKAAAAFSEG